jgi:hypothetical protein
MVRCGVPKWLALDTHMLLPLRTYGCIRHGSSIGLCLRRVVRPLISLRHGIQGLHFMGIAVLSKG